MYCKISQDHFNLPGILQCFDTNSMESNLVTSPLALPCLTIPLFISPPHHAPETLFFTLPTLYLLSSKTELTMCKNSLSYPHPLPKPIFGSSANHIYHINSIHNLLLFIIYRICLWIQRTQARHIPFF